VEASGGEGAIDAARLNAFLVAALSRVVCAAVPIPVDAATSASVLPSAAVGGFGAGVRSWGTSRHLGSLTAANLVSFVFSCFLLLLLRLILNKHSSIKKKLRQPCQRNRPATGV